MPDFYLDNLSTVLSWMLDEEYISITRIIMGLLFHIACLSIVIVFNHEDMFKDSNIEFSIFFIVYLGVILLPIVVLFLRTAIGIDSEQPITIYFFLYRLVEIHSDIIFLFYGLKLEDFEMTLFSIIAMIVCCLDLLISLYSFKTLLDEVLRHEDTETFERIINYKAMCSVWCLMPLSCLFVGPVFLKRSRCWGCLKGCCWRNAVIPDPTPPPLPPRENTRPISPRDNPLLPGYLVQEWIHKVYLYGGLINPRIVMAAADGIVKKYGLKSNYGDVNITKTNAESLLRRMGFVNRKSTKAINHLPEDFDVIKKGFIDKIKTLVVDHEVPDSLIMNWSQTVCHVVPGGDWAKEKKVTTRGMYANDQITLLLAVTKEGTLLPPQLIYSGKTESCVPKFPDSWDSTYTESCLSNEDTMIRYVEKVVIPYLKTVRESYPESKKAIAIFEESHSGEKLIKRLDDNGIVPVFVPTGCCNKLQPLDISFKREYKEELKSQFHKWYAEQVSLNQQEDSKEFAKNMVVDLKISALRPIHPEWIKSTHSKMEARKELIQTGFREIGLH